MFNFRKEIVKLSLRYGTWNEEFVSNLFYLIKQNTNEETMRAIVTDCMDNVSETKTIKTIGYDLGGN